MTKPFTISPIYAAASRAIQARVRQSFRQSKYGRLLHEIERAARMTHTTSGPERMRLALQAFQRAGGAAGVRSLYGTPLGEMRREIEQYARRGVPQKVLGEFLGQLGPVGKIIQSLIQPSSAATFSGPGMAPALRRDFQSMLDMMAAFSGDRSVQDALRQILEQRGYRVIAPDDQQDTSVKGKIPTRSPNIPEPKAAPKGRQRSTVDVRMEHGTRRFPKDHPIVTGELVQTPESSNVHSYGYDNDSATLFVRYKAPSNQPGPRPHQPGPLYEYKNVPPTVFLKMLAAASKGEFVWDRLRIRGTVSGHKFDYALVGTMGGYVPRKATMTPHGEAYIPRQVRGHKGTWMQSQRPFELVRPMVPAGSPNRGQPNRGAPNRGRP